MNESMIVVALLGIALGAMFTALSMNKRTTAVRLAETQARREDLAVQHNIASGQKEVELKKAEAMLANVRGDLPTATAVCNKYGFAVVRPDEIPHMAARMGNIVLAPDAWSQLLDAIRARTNIDSKVDDMLKQAGFDPKPPPKRWTDKFPPGME